MERRPLGATGLDVRVVGTTLCRRAPFSEVLALVTSRAVDEIQIP